MTEVHRIMNKIEKVEWLFLFPLSHGRKLKGNEYETDTVISTCLHNAWGTPCH